MFKDACDLTWASLVVQTVKNPPAMQETWVQSLGWKDPLEEGISTHSSILPWEIPWTENREAWWATESDMAEWLNIAHYLIYIPYERKLLLNLVMLLDTGYHYKWQCSSNLFYLNLCDMQPPKWKTKIEWLYNLLRSIYHTFKLFLKTVFSLDKVF